MVSMEKLFYHHDFPFTLLLLLIITVITIYSSSNLLMASGYTLPDKYFINCGSSSNTTVDGRIFIGDVNPRSSYFSVRPSVELKDSNPKNGTSPLYQTARVFEKKSSYEFQITENGTYVVRFHFYPFLSPTNLTRAVFDVRAAGYSLLSNFKVQNRSTSPVIREFAIPMKVVENLTILFTPQKSSFAFVNAMEVFLAPNKFVPDNVRHVTPAGYSDTYRDVDSKALLITHRINVGGQTIPPKNDTLWRSWTPDDDYLLLPGSAKNSVPYNETLVYVSAKATNYSAPDDVYKTSKELNKTYNKTSSFFNVTWGFGVNKNSTYFVRVHFCDIISKDETGIVFNFSIYGQIGDNIYSLDSSDENSKVGTPFYKNYVVDTDDSGLINITIGPHPTSSNKNAYLNGVEIMELITEESSGLSSSPSKHNKNLILIIVGSVIGGLLVCLLILLVVIPKCRKASFDESGEYSGAGGYLSWITDRISETSVVSNLNLGLKISFSEIRRATHGFDKKFMIGEGGFGKVYRGELRDKRKVAVKRSLPGLGQGANEFETEIRVLTKIRHRHLVSLIGYCDERREMILVYEFMENGTLKDLLYDANEDNSVSSPKSELPWEKRLEICIASAMGLDYLHRGAKIIHRDVKCTNILLDENYTAKVADFGLSKSGDAEQTHMSTDVKGSFGYLDPEYFRCMQLTDKSDVYSFGVVLLEVLCARPAIKTSVPKAEMNLAEWAIPMQKRGELEKIMDPFLVGKINPNSLRKFGETAEKCLRETGVDRPTMRQVVWDLQYALDLQQARMPRDAYADGMSITDDSFDYFSMSGVPYTSPTSLIIEEDEEMPPPVEGVEGDDGSEATATAVFSQLGIGGAAAGAR